MIIARRKMIISMCLFVTVECLHTPGNGRTAELKSDTTGSALATVEMDSTTEPMAITTSANSADTRDPDPELARAFENLAILMHGGGGGESVQDTSQETTELALNASDEIDEEAGSPTLVYSPNLRSPAESRADTGVLDTQVGEVADKTSVSADTFHHPVEDSRVDKVSL